MQRSGHTSRVLAVTVGLIVMLLPINAWSRSRSQADQRCFAETGFCMSGRIREYWEQNGSLNVFGFPIAAQQQELSEGRALQVQWFERHRIELHPENQAPYDVLLGRLGVDLLAQQGRPLEKFPTSAPESGCRSFPETKHSICGEFLEAWHASGIELDGVFGTNDDESIALFGKPLSESHTENVLGRQLTVQWFERARFELHPENAPPYRVLFGLLGREYRSSAAQPPTPTRTPTATPTRTTTVTPTLTPTSKSGSDSGGQFPPFPATEVPTISSSDVPGQIGPYTPGPGGQCAMTLSQGRVAPKLSTEIGISFRVCIERFLPGKAATVRLLRANGTEILHEQVDIASTGGANWFGLVTPAEKPGSITVTIKQGTLEARGSIVLSQASTPRVIVLPRSGKPGTTFRVYLAGYQQDADRRVRLYLYRDSKFFKALPTAQIDANGTAMITLATTEKEKLDQYYVAAEPVPNRYNVLGLDVFTIR